MTALVEFLRRETGAPLAPEVRAFARRLAEAQGAAAVLFYGSALRNGELSGVLDFYVLVDAPRHRGPRSWLERWLWPEIGFHRFEADGRELSAKVATLPMRVFARAAKGRALDTTVWTRFAQPSRLAHARDASAEAQVLGALADAACTAAAFAARLGPETGAPRDYWVALFRATYAAELRVEPPGRERDVVDAAPDRYDALLPLAWTAGDVPFAETPAGLRPRLSRGEAERLARAWRLRRLLGKPLNAARLVKAALTAPGAVRYAAGKLARHTDLAVEATPWRERHPLAAGLGVLWRLRRSRQADAR